MPSPILAPVARERLAGAAWQCHASCLATLRAAMAAGEPAATLTTLLDAADVARVVADAAGRESRLLPAFCRAGAEVAAAAAAEGERRAAGDTAPARTEWRGSAAACTAFAAVCRELSA